jgi:toxin YoeB
VSWSVRFTNQAQKDARKLAAASPALKAKAVHLLELLSEDHLRQPPPFAVLVGDLRGALSRRLNIQHRLVYQVLPVERLVKVLRLWTHDE